MKLILQTIKFILGLIGIGFLHIAIAFLLPPPFHSIHVIFISIVMILFLYEHGSIVWFAALLFIMLDFPSLQPFGLSLISGVVATTGMLLLYRNVFTNRSLFAATVLLSIGYVLYRLVFVASDIVQYIVHDRVFDVVGHIQIYSIELILTIVTLVVIYLITTKFSYKLQHTHIQESWFRTLRAE
jgi:hypothetical protein